MSGTSVVLYFQLQEIALPVPPEHLQLLESRFPTVVFRAVDERAELPAALTDAEVFYGWHLPADAFAAAQRLRWVHMAAAGVEANLFPALVQSPIVVTNSSGLHAAAMGEHVIGMMIALARNLATAMRLQQSRTWDRGNIITDGIGIRELHGANLLVIGLGPVGAAVARYAHALGMVVKAIRRNPTLAAPPGVEEVCGRENLAQLLGWADFVVLALPSTTETARLLDRDLLAAMRPTTFLVNVARGTVVDEPALVDALAAGRLAGAALDVFDAEPLSSSHRLWTLPNVIVTPHVSGYTPGYLDKALALFMDNLERHVRGTPLRNVVDKAAGYCRTRNPD